MITSTRRWDREMGGSAITSVDASVIDPSPLGGLGAVDLIL